VPSVATVTAPSPFRLPPLPARNLGHSGDPSSHLVCYIWTHITISHTSHRWISFTGKTVGTFTNVNSDPLDDHARCNCGTRQRCATARRCSCCTTPPIES